MLQKHKEWLTMSALAVAIGCLSAPALAEITLLDQNPQPYDPLSRLKFQVGGSIRPQFFDEMGNSDKGSYKRNGYDGGTRFRFSADYYLFDDVSVIGYYELGVNIPRVFNWEPHYAKNAHETDRRMLYGGLKSKTYGTLTYGKQNSIYYTVIGAKTDVWDNDMHAQAPGNGFNGNYDGSYRGRNLIQYKNTFGDADVYLGGILADSEYGAGKDLRYKRKGGGAIGVDYHLTKDLTWGTVYSYTQAEIKNTSNAPSGAGSHSYNQQLLGTGLSWKPDNWTLAATVGWYKDFLMTTRKARNDYFAGNAYGVEYYAGYTFPVEKFFVKNITPYYAGDRLKYNTDRDYQANHQYIGITTKFAYGFQIDLEHTFSNTTDHQSDANLVRLRYDF